MNGICETFLNLNFELIKQTQQPSNEKETAT